MSDASAQQMMKLNHLGEFIAVNIYSAQIRVCRFTSPQLLPLLKDFLAHEVRHLRIFEAELADRHVMRCKAFPLLGFAGFLLGFLTALLGKTGVMACTAAVETVVLKHLQRQLDHLRRVGDMRALAAIESILQDEIEHRETGAEKQGSLIYAPVYTVIAPATALVIKLGMRL
jgi:ubiquinone biosynthesis monooxygenase Coq7